MSQDATGQVRAAVSSLVLAGLLTVAVGAQPRDEGVKALAADPTVRSLALLSASTDYRGLRIEAALRKVDCPVLLVAGSNDPYALRSALALVGTGGRRETVNLADAGHGTTMLVRQPDLTARLVDWFRRSLL